MADDILGSAYRSCTAGIDALPDQDIAVAREICRFYIAVYNDISGGMEYGAGSYVSVYLNTSVKINVSASCRNILQNEKACDIHPVSIHFDASGVSGNIGFLIRQNLKADPGQAGLLFS